MKYSYIENARTSSVWKDADNNSWGYVKKKPSKYFADVYKKSRVESHDCLVFEQHEVMVEPSKKRLGLFEKVVGYIPCVDEQNNEGYIRIVAFSPIKCITALVVILALLIGGLYYFQKATKPADDTPIKIKTGQMYNPDPANIRLPGIENVYAKPGKTKVNLPLLNIEGNGYDLVYTITLAKTSEVLYVSPKIKPGYGVKQFDMTRTFKKGKYPIMVTVESSAQKDRQGKDKDQGVAYNVGRINATLVVR